MPKPTEPKPEALKHRLRRLRERAGHTPSSLAHAVGVTEGAVRQMESGQTKSPSFPVGILLAHELGVTPEFLAFGQDGVPLGDAAQHQGGDKIAALERRVTAIERAILKPKRR